MWSLNDGIPPVPQTALEKFYQQIIESLEGGVFVTDAKGTIIFLEGSGTPDYFLGLKKEDLLGKNIDYLVKEGINPRPATYDVIQTKNVVMRYFISGVGTKQFVISRPVFDENSELQMVVSYTLLEATLHEVTAKLAYEKENYQQLATYISKPKPDTQAIVAESASMKALLQILDKVANTDGTILLTGESGTGKEVLAHYIHNNSSKKELPFIPVNCAAIPNELMEAEFFGYAPNSFTGASKEGKAGLFELVGRGTLMLDELGEMPLSMQSKLLRVLETGEFRRIGSNKIIRSKARIIAATNRDLMLQIKEKTFREDLYYRINVLPIHIPPLRERKADILPLADYFLKLYNEKHHAEKLFSDITKNRMLNYEWPGNVRELRNVIERMILTTSGQYIMPEMLNFKSSSPAPNEIKPVNTQSGLYDAVKEFERNYIESVFLENNNNITPTAKQLQMPISTLYQKLKEHGIRSKKQK